MSLPSFSREFDSHHPLMNSSHFTFEGRTVTSVNLLLLISEMEGTSQHLKYMGFKEDLDTINEMKKRYYKLYFKTKKEENVK